MIRGNHLKATGVDGRVRAGRCYPLIIRISVTLAMGVVWTAPQARATPVATTTTLTLSSSSIASGEPVTLTASVLAGATPVTTGRVMFCNASATDCENAALLGIAQLTSAGTATLKFIPGIGSHGYLAEFLATTADAASTSSAQTLTVTGIRATSTTISSSGAAGNYTLTGTVVEAGSASVAPNESVSFLDTSNINYVVGSAMLGAATLAQTFAAQVTYATGSGPDAVAVGDFNGDGNPDLAVANYGSSNAGVLLGTSAGTFGTAVTYAIGSGPDGLAVGDFNGDGNPDIVAANDGGVGFVPLGNLVGRAEFVIGSYDFLNAAPISGWIAAVRLSRFFHGVN